MLVTGGSEYMTYGRAGCCSMQYGECGPALSLAVWGGYGSVCACKGRVGLISAWCAGAAGGECLWVCRWGYRTSPSLLCMLCQCLHVDALLRDVRRIVLNLAAALVPRSTTIHVLS